MPEAQSLRKVLNIRENEKKAAQLAHHRSQELFEDIAMNMYTLLKKKESAEAYYEKTLSMGMPIDKIQEQIRYIESLQIKIITIQEELNEARNKMQLKQSKLTDAHLEVKKFEKVIDFRVQERLEEERKAEQLFMDDIATQQYVRQNTGEFSEQIY